jgi:hypothetical protein
MFEILQSRVAVVLALVAGLGTGCWDGNQAQVPLWTVEQAESITSVRGQPVRVRHCRGTGTHERHENAKLYSRFECLAAARAAFQRYDTVAVHYVLHPLEDDGPTSRYRLTNVRFIGGPGVP